jgi:general nucleoside transport system permease protein
VATGSGTVGLLAAMGAGVVFAALFAVVTIWLRADQIVSGTALNLLAAGISATAWGAFSSPLPEVEPRLSPYVMVIVAVVLAAKVIAMFRLTRTGLIIRALGDAPDACNAAGIRVRWWRTGCVLFGGACAGAAGAYLSIMRIFQFSPDQTGGRGFLVLALVIFGRWNMLGLIAGCLLFGLTDDLQRYLQGYAFAQHIPEDAFKMLPYVATLAALAILTRTKAAPTHLGRPWPEE